MGDTEGTPAVTPPPKPELGSPDERMCVKLECKECRVHQVQFCARKEVDKVRAEWAKLHAHGKGE
jgi:hypothetical protein